MDRISSLPDGVIIHILSFLPIKEAASTSVLSKRWRILFAFSPNLEFFDYEEDTPQSFIDFVDRVQGVEQEHFNRWIRDVVNRGVLDLDLGIDEYSLPAEVFTCKTLLKLNLTGFWINELPEDASLPALQTLFLDSVRVCAFEKLLSACPVLEDLVIRDVNWEQWKWSRVVSSPSLQRLTINRHVFNDFDGSDFGSITIDAPSVTYLYYSDFIPGCYPVVNLESLVEANLDLVGTVDHTWESGLAYEDGNITSNPTNLIKGLRNVEIMNLLGREVMEMFYIFREAIPVFEKLFRLYIVTTSKYCWRALPFLLNNSPNLKTLTIKGTLHYDQSERGSSVCECLLGYSFLLTCPVKVIKITEYSGTTGEVEQLKHFLGKLSSLELLKIKISEPVAKKSQISKDLIMLPRASSKCEIKVK